ncbi:MAG TPA: class I adenylate-forming enzyme family protein [Acidimicrobiales bacterium]|nr:class I adenylate-forming enzyme family protein [Acidimicrobiales bacterium]
MDSQFVDVDTQLSKQGAERASKPFLISIDQGRQITFGELNEISNQIACFLHERGVARGDRVSLLVENTIECVLVYLGVQRYGAVANPVNIQVNAKNVAHILHDVEPAMVVYNESDSTFASALRESAPQAQWVSYHPLDAAVKTSESSLFTALETVSPASWRDQRDGTDAFTVLTYTSGTSGSPKGVIHTRESYFRCTEATTDMVGLTHGDRILEFRNLSWISPQVLTVGCSLFTGATAVIASTFSRSQFLDWLETYEITVAVGVPTVLNMLLEDKEPVDPHRFPKLRFMTSSTAPLSIERHREFEAHYGIPIMQYYGMSEAGFMAGNREDRHKLGSVGPATLYQMLRIEDEEGRRLPPGEPGQIVVGGKQMAWGYLLGRGQLEPIPDRTGFPTGDLGFLDEEGFLVITGRTKDIIIRGGVNIAPTEVNEALMAHPAVREAATIGVPDRIYGEEIVSFVELRQPIGIDAILEHCRRKLSDYKMPRKVIAVEEIPKSDRGKVLTSALRELWHQQAIHQASGKSSSLG